MGKHIIYILISILFVSCVKDDVNHLSPPTITLDSPSSIYTTKVGKSITVSPYYENVTEATYQWLSESGALLGCDPSLTFVTDLVGRYFVTLQVTTAGGSEQVELRIDVFDITPPIISLVGFADGTKILQHSLVELNPSISSPLKTTFQWRLDGCEVSSKQKYILPTQNTGVYKVSLTTTNEDGSDYIEFSVEVCDANQVDFAWNFLQEEYNVAVGRKLQLSIYDVLNAFDAEFVWTIDGVEVQRSALTKFVFDANRQGTYNVLVEMQNQYMFASRQLTVNVCPAEGEYRRIATNVSSASSIKVYEFVPAPGQFVNENYVVNNMEEACAYAQRRLDQQAYVSLGSFGGYIVVGFDHSIDNDGDYNIAITGNAFDGSSEPGIVWVMQDENGDGQPNDTWYELKGSEYGNSSTIADYAVTYYRPTSANMGVSWVDNNGNSGVVDYLGAFHTQAYYYPAWVRSDSYTLRGPRLEARNYDKSGNGTYWVNGSYDWGYVDNYSLVDRLTDDDNYNAAPADNHFKISNAVTFDGNQANLKYIDFIKVQVAVMAKSGWLGEVSTEVFGIKDFNLLKQ